jgi:membrane protein implicated in regulation of membrane protease activity
MNNVFYLWIVVALLCLVFEMGHPGLFLFLSFCFGALTSAGISMVTDSLITQCLVFLGVSITALCVLLKWVKKSLDTDHAHHKTNAQALVGKQAIVTRDITVEGPGEVRVGGELWMARAAHEAPIKTGTRVIVKMVRGAHVVVEPITPSQSV